MIDLQEAFIEAKMEFLFFLIEEDTDEPKKEILDKRNSFEGIA